MNNRLSNICWGTHEENEADRRLHGRQFRPRGEKCGMSRFTSRQIVLMRALWNCGAKIYMIANLFNSRQEVIARNVRGTRWGHLPLNPNLNALKELAV